jgi:hypothetical protein
VATVRLKDPSGELDAAIHQSVLDKQVFSPGFVLEVENAVIFKPSKTRSCLNITSLNLVAVMSPKGERQIWGEKPQKEFGKLSLT